MKIWSNSIDNPSVKAWEGFTFEQVCKDHIQQIMLIDRRDKVINICEIKFASNEYEIDKDYEKKLVNKIESFRKSTATKKALHLTMITPYGIKRNVHSGKVQSEVVMDDLFFE